MGAAVIAMVLWLLPPAAEHTAAPGPNVVRGAYHVHTSRSDGSGTPEQVAAAAAAAGLQFVILTDHGDGTRPPDAPEYRSGVLVIDAVEVNTTAGHLAVLGIPRSPYPLAGTASAVLEDVHRLGGFGIAAHPGSPRPSLSWRAWDAPIDGLEWINGDSEWRDEPRAPIARALLTYLVRAPESIATLLDRPTNVMARWDELNAVRPTFAFAGIDAHARLGFTQEGDPDTSALHVPIPGYGASFRTLTNHVLLESPFSGDAASDAARLLAAIRRGRSYSVADALATPGALAFTASRGHETKTIGDVLLPGEEIVLRASLSAPTGTTLVLLKNGDRVHQVGEGPLEFRAAGERAFYRIEAYVPGSPGGPAVPWIVSNAIYVGGAAAGTVADQPAWMTTVAAAAGDATAEAGTRDRSELTGSTQPLEPGSLRWRFELSGGAPAGQFAALQIPVSGVHEYSAVRFRVSASRPTRAWVQMRVPNGSEDRWGSTFYANGIEREVVIPFSALQPIGVASNVLPAERVRSLLFVVDTLNSLPGSAGEMALADIAWLR
jgi:hypothetical protein